MRTITLNGSWKLKAAELTSQGAEGLAKIKKERSGWLDATVPGEVHLDLIKAGQMEEPLVSTNAHTCRWPEKKSWWYRRSFEIPASFLTEEEQSLVFDGIDLYGQVFLNGDLLGECRNALVSTTFDVRHTLRKGRNELVVRVTCGSELSPEAQDERLGREPKDLYEGKQNWPGRRFLRKPQFTYGWDWVDSLPNIGIWRGVQLTGYSGVKLFDVRADTLRHGNDVYVELETVLENIHPWSSRECSVEITIQPPKGKTMRQTRTLTVRPGRQPETTHIKIPDPQLWWPNGMGDQPLYQVTVTVQQGKAECDRRRFACGLRTITIDQTPLKEGRRFCIQVNGEDVFCRGGNWIPADAIIARVDKKKYEALIAAAKEANFNMLRIWGGGIYEDDLFYELCTGAGILVWHDFMFACSEYPDENAEFRQAVRDEAEAAVRRLRHHTAIALWSGNNENTWGFREWWNRNQTGFEADIKLGGRILYNEILPEICRALDPRRPYWPSSPCGGTHPNGETEGDCHWWGPATMNADIERRIHHEIYDECRARFNSEYGIIGPCHMDSIRQYLKPDELTVESPAFKVHTNGYEKDTTPAAIRCHYADPEKLSLEEYVTYGQMFQAMMYGLTIESMRFRKRDSKDDCAGALIWMYNDCWGETGWTPIDYYLRRKASYYWIKRACAPLKPIVRQRGRNLVVRLVNDSLTPGKGVLLHGWVRLDGRDSHLDSTPVTLQPNSMQEMGRVTIPGARTLNPAEWLYLALLQCEDGTESQSVYLLRCQRDLSLPKSAIDVKVTGRTLELTSPVYCHGVHIEDRGRGAWSDNFFELLPGITKRIERTDGKVIPRAPRIKVVMAHPRMDCSRVRPSLAKEDPE